MDLDELLKELAVQEEELLFDTFSNEDAYELGTLLYSEAKRRGLSLSIDINRSGQQLFHAALPGTAPDNDRWMERKVRVVNRFHHSSYYINTLLRKSGQSIEEMYHVSSFEFAPNGGCFPVNVKNVGVIGTVTVSGLPQAEDHAFLVSVLRMFLKKK